MAKEQRSIKVGYIYENFNFWKKTIVTEVDGIFTDHEGTRYTAKGNIVGKDSAFARNLELRTETKDDSHVD